MNPTPTQPNASATANLRTGQPVTNDTIYKLVRVVNGPLPETGVILGEEKSMYDGAELWKVAIIGYNPNKPTYLRKSDCREMQGEELQRWQATVRGWLELSLR